MRKIGWPTRKEQHAHMLLRQQQNIEKARENLNENWFLEKLRATPYKWSRQAQWGFRIFDFWCHELGVAVEIDGWGHDPEKDYLHDEYHFRRSGIVVLRVRNRNETDAEKALKIIGKIDGWKARREAMGLEDKNSQKYLQALELPNHPSLLEAYIQKVLEEPM